MDSCKNHLSFLPRFVCFFLKWIFLPVKCSFVFAARLSLSSHALLFFISKRNAMHFHVCFPSIFDRKKLWLDLATLFFSIWLFFCFADHPLFGVDNVCEDIFRNFDRTFYGAQPLCGPANVSSQVKLFYTSMEKQTHRRALVAKVQRLLRPRTSTPRRHQQGAAPFTRDTCGAWLVPRHSTQVFPCPKCVSPPQRGVDGGACWRAPSGSSATDHFPGKRRSSLQMLDSRKAPPSNNASFPCGAHTLRGHRSIVAYAGAPFNVVGCIRTPPTHFKVVSPKKDRDGVSLPQFSLAAFTMAPWNFDWMWTQLL